MCEIHTSVVARVHPLWVVLLVVTAVSLGVVGGYALRNAAVFSPSTDGGGVVLPPLSITAAGTLSGAFPRIADWVANAMPGASAPAAAQSYQGSIAALNSIAQLHQSFDVAAAADFRLIPSLLEPSFASWEVLFATSPEVLALSPTATAAGGPLNGITTTNWVAKLEQPNVLLGVANASLDPNGYNTIFVLQLEGFIEAGTPAAVYGHFFTTPVGSVAQPDPATTRVEPETQAAALLTSNTVQAFFIYRSYAISHNLPYVDLDPRINLGGFTSTDLSTYANARTAVLNAHGTITVLSGAPIAYSVTVPRDAPSPNLGDLFVEALLSPVGTGVLTGLGFVPISPAWVDLPSALPPTLAPWVTPLPASLAQELS